MPERNIELTRRKILAGLGAAGVASVGAGVGTSALFSDEESFTGNTLAAGTLDLKVDWEEHYYHGLDGLGDLDVQLVGSSVPDGYVGFPSTDPTVAVATDDVSAFMDATAVEAYPDPTGDGSQDAFASSPDSQTENGVGYVCEDGADTDDDLDPRNGFRTENADTLMPAPNGDGQVPAPLFNLGDVKPGDFGEATLSFHLCDNPGYVWLNGELVSASENGLTEPESADGDDDDSQGELLDEIQTTLWYDDGNNILDSGSEQVSGDPVDVVIVLDTSGSMDSETGKFPSAQNGAIALVNALGSSAQVGLVSFTSSATLDQPLTTDKSAVTSAINGLSANGGTDIANAVDAGREELTGDDVSGDVTASGNDRDNAQKVMVFLTNGSDNEEQAAINAANEMKNVGELYTIAYGSGANTTLLEDMASSPAGTYSFVAPTQSEVEGAFDDIGEEIVVPGGEEVIFSGSLRETLSELSSGDGIALDSTPDAEERGCYSASSTHYIGFEWRLPLSVGNVVQSDTVSFDLGFYAEQCRNNDGA